MATLKQTLKKCSVVQLEKLHKIINSNKVNDHITEDWQKSPERLRTWNRLIRKELLRKYGVKQNKKSKNKGIILVKSKIQRIL